LGFWPGHPRLQKAHGQVVDARPKGGHDEVMIRPEGKTPGGHDEVMIRPEGKKPGGQDEVMIRPEGKKPGGHADKSL
jgi:hypothetical protein